MSSIASETLRQLAQAYRLRELSAAEPLGRHIRIDGRDLLNLGGNDYLALSRHPRLIQAATRAIDEHGVGAGASRLLCGTLPIHEEAERRFAAFKHAEAALLLPTGYTANLAVLTTLAGPGDLVVMDKLVHASLIDAARASGAEVRTFPHLNLERAEALLERLAEGKRFLVTDSVFSMDGDCADLRGLCDLADRSHAVLVVDEAHATGVLGHDGGGLVSELGLTDRIYQCGAGGIVVSTASKALGSLGGIITATKPVIDLIVNKGRPFIYSTAVPPAQAASIIAALDVLSDSSTLRGRLRDIIFEVRLALKDAGWQTLASHTPIVPLPVGSEEAATRLAQRLRDKGIYAPAIRPPTVAPGSSRVRLSLRTDLSDDELDHLLDAIGTPGG